MVELCREYSIMNAMIEKVCELSTYIMVEAKGEKSEILYGTLHVSDITFYGFSETCLSV